MPAAFMAWIAPIAISSLLARTKSNGSPEDIQLVIKSCASSRDQFADCSSMMVMKLHISMPITSPRPQTTRNTIRGVLTQPPTQFVFVDTPGLHRPRTALGERLNRLVYGSLAETDAELGRCLRVAKGQVTEETL